MLFESLVPTNKEWKISDDIQRNLHKYLRSQESHGQFYPPPKYWDIQQAFMKESGFMIRNSNITYAKGLKSM